MALGRKTGGRKAGTPNKMTTAIKEAFQSAFDTLGGDKALAEWAADNKTEFYKLASKFIPQDINASIKEAPKIIFELNNGGSQPTK